MSKIRESKIENYLSQQVKLIGGLSYKFTSNVNGVPDRIVIFNGSIYLIEVKRPNEVPRPTQDLVHNKIREQNVPVFVIDTREGVDEFISETLDVNIELINNQSTQSNQPVTIRNKSAFDI